MRRWEWILVIGLSLGALALYSFDLNSPRYLYQGEYFFYRSAKDICHGEGWSNPFSERGVEGIHPRLDSYYQAAVMRLAGVNVFGLKLSSVLAAVASIIPLYVFLRLSTSLRVALAGTLCFCFSYYSMSWAHTAWNNNHVIFPFVLSLCLFAVAVKRRRLVLFGLCGFSTGLAFYTYYPARLTLILITILFIQWRISIRSRVGRYFLCFLIIFTVTVAPLVISTGPAEMIRHAASKSTGHSEWGDGSAAQKIATHVFLSLLAPIYYSGGKHTTNTLFDTVTAAFFIVGIVYCVVRWRGTYLFLLLGFVVSASLIGATTPQVDIRGSRMLFLIPIVCMIAGIGADRLFVFARWFSGGRKYVYLPLAVAAMGLMIWLNLRRLYVVLPEEKGIEPFGLAIQYFRDAPSDGRYYYILARGFDYWAIYDIEAYVLADKVTVYGLEDVLAGSSTILPPCGIVLCNLGEREVQSIIEYLNERFRVSGHEMVQKAGRGWGSLELIGVAECR